MKKIEAIIKRSSYPTIAGQLSSVGYSIIDKRNLEDSNFVDKYKASKAGSTGIRSVPLAKIELVVSDKDAKNVIGIISKKSGFATTTGKIFVSEMQEIVDIQTQTAQQDLEEIHTKSYTPKNKRSRLVPLQKYTLLKIQKIYDNNQEILRSDYRIKSFSDFVNHCIMGYLPTIEKQLKHPTIMYENAFNEL